MSRLTTLPQQNVPVPEPTEVQQAVANVNNSLQQLSVALQQLQSIFTFAKTIKTPNGITVNPPAATLNTLNLVNNGSTAMLTMDVNGYLVLNPSVVFGIYTGTSGLTQTGYVVIKDSSGTIRRLLVG